MSSAVSDPLFIESPVVRACPRLLGPTDSLVEFSPLCLLLSEPFQFFVLVGTFPVLRPEAVLTSLSPIVLEDPGRTGVSTVPLVVNHLRSPSPGSSVHSALASHHIHYRRLVFGWGAISTGWLWESSLSAVTRSPLPGRNRTSVFLLSHVGPAVFLPSLGRPFQNQPSASREIQRSDGRPVQRQTGPERAGVSSTMGSLHSQSVRSPVGGPVRFGRQLQTSDVLLQVPPPNNLGSRCSLLIWNDLETEI